MKTRQLAEAAQRYLLAVGTHETVSFDKVDIAELADAERELNTLVGAALVDPTAATETECRHCGATEHGPEAHDPWQGALQKPACPGCGAPEVAANSPRTAYTCGSSDYDQRPGSFVGKCGGA